MRVIVGDSMKIILTDEEAEELCKIGKGKETCVWLALGKDGFECLGKNKPLVLYQRWMSGGTKAKRDGCDKINRWIPSEKGEFEI